MATEMHPDIYRVLQRLQQRVMQQVTNAQQTDFNLQKTVELMFETEGFYELERVRHTSTTMDVIFINRMLNKRVTTKFFRRKRVDMKNPQIGADKPSGYVYMIDVKQSAPEVKDLR